MALSRATEPVVLVRNGVRSVSPYYFEYRTPFKERWRGRSAPHVLRSELGQCEAAVHSAIDSGDIYVTANNGKKGGPVAVTGSAVYTHTLSGHDIIHNLQHCHEPDVRVHSEHMSHEDGTCSAKKRSKNSIWSLIYEIIGDSKLRSPEQTTPSTEPMEFSPKTENLTKGSSRAKSGSAIDILYEDSEMVFVNKPGGVPTHPGGIYRYNSVSEILAHELQCPVWPCHRLDKSTSGVMAFAKSKRASTAFMSLFQAKRDVEKWYVARVDGHFSYPACSYRCPVFSINAAANAYVNVANQAQVPTNSTTEFYKIHYSTEHDYSIVLCRPITGRMHQIRIHLRNLGHPIANDGLYKGDTEASRLKKDVELQIYEELWKKFPGFGGPDEMAPVSGPGPQRAPETGPDSPCAHKTWPHKLGPESGPPRAPETVPLPETISVPDFITPKIKACMTLLSQSRADHDSRLISGVCAECSRPLYESSTDPDPGIWLHALALRWRQGQGSSLVMAPVPSWCA